MSRLRRRWTFGLRLLLLVFSVAALALGWQARLTQRQRRAVAALVAKGAVVRYDHSYRWPMTVVAAGRSPHWTARWLGVDWVAAVTLVDLQGGQFGDADVALLGDLPRLEWVRLYETRVTSAGMEVLPRLSRLRSLVIERGPVDDRGWTVLGKLRGLESLCLVALGLTDRGAEGLSGLARLKTLVINDCAGVGDGACHAIGKLGGPQSAMQELSLEHSQATDAGLGSLHGLRRLQRVSLYGVSTITRDGANRLRQALPGLNSLIVESAIASAREAP